MMPYAILGGEVQFEDGEQLGIRVLEVSEEGFTFRVGNELKAQIETQVVSIKLHFYSYKESNYNSWLVKEYSLEVDEETEFYICYRMKIIDEEFTLYAKELMKEYMHYIQLKLECSDAELSQDLTGYSALGEEEYSEDFFQQKREWFAALNVDNSWKEALEVWKTGRGEYDHHGDRGKREVALRLDNPKLWEKYMQMRPNEFSDWYYAENKLERHPLAQKEFDVLHIGNEFCPLLFPDKNVLEALLDKAFKDGKRPVVVFSVMREFQIEEKLILNNYEKTLHNLYMWCMERKVQLELIINDWGMAAMIREKGYTCFLLTLGLLLNKRRKDVRLPYKNGYEQQIQALKENSLNADFYRDYLKERYEIEGFSYESCDYPYQLAGKRRILHIPFYQMNTSGHCTLYASCKNGNRAKQELVKECPEYCKEYAFLYPKMLHMAGVYNSLFGYDKRILEDGEYLEEFLEQEVERVVVGFL